MKKKILIIAMALALVSVIAMPIAAFAEDSTVTGQQGVSINISVPASVAFGTFSSVNGPNSSNQSITVNTTGTWQIQVKDAMDTFGSVAKPAGSGGKMVEASGTDYITPSPKILTNALVIDASSVGGVSVTLSASDQALFSGQLAYSGTKSIAFRQTTAYDPALPAENSYRIVVTFTASAT